LEPEGGHVQEENEKEDDDDDTHSKQASSSNAVAPDQMTFPEDDGKYSKRRCEQL